MSRRRLPLSLLLAILPGCATTEPEPGSAETGPSSSSEGRPQTEGGNSGATSTSTSSPQTTAPATTSEESSGLTSSSSDTTGDPRETDGPIDPGLPQSACGDRTLAVGAPVFAPPTELQGNGGTGGSAAGDLDGDGRDEFVAQIQFRIYDWDGSQWQSFQPLASLQNRRDRFAGDIELADINGDGNLDIVVPDSDNSGSQGSLSWFENPGTLAGEWTEHVVTTFDGSAFENTVTHLSELEVADLDGDGAVDLVVRDISHGVWVLVQRDGGWAPRRFIEVLPREGLELADLDDDGRPDLVLNGQWLKTPVDPATEGFELHPILGMEAWVAPDASTASIRDYACKVETGDFNADGRLDIAITNAEELAGDSPNKPRGIALFLQPDALLSEPWTEVVLTDERWAWHTLELSDFDHDGSLDVLSAISAVGTDNGGDDIGIWLGDGDAAFSRLTISSEHTVYQGRLGDSDGDGDCDFLAPDHFNNGPVRWFENVTELR